MWGAGIPGNICVGGTRITVNIDVDQTRKLKLGGGVHWHPRPCVYEVA